MLADNYKVNREKLRELLSTDPIVESVEASETSEGGWVLTIIFEGTPPVQMVEDGGELLVWGTLDEAVAELEKLGFSECRATSYCPPTTPRGQVIDLAAERVTKAEVMEREFRCPSPTCGSNELTLGLMRKFPKKGQNTFHAYCEDCGCSFMVDAVFSNLRE